MSLPVSNLVTASVNLTQQPAGVRSFGILLILGDSPVISGLERMREYTSLSAVASDFGSSSPEYQAAILYFSQSPQPAQVNIGRWLRVPAPAKLLGGALSSSQSQLSNFLSITSGGFSVTVDGVVKNLANLNFSTATNLNAVAADVSTALAGAGVCTWTGSGFKIVSASAGAGIAASGTISFSANPANADTVTINGTSVEFVSASPTGEEVLIGANANATAVNLATFLNASTDANISAMRYAAANGVVTCSAKQVGTAGNALTLAKSSSSITVSAATLSGGQVPSSIGYASSPASGQDVSALLGLTQAQGQPLVPGYAAESALQCVQAFDDLSTEWYGVEFAASVMPSVSDNLAVAPYIEAANVTRMFGITTQDPNTLLSVVTNDLASQLVAGAYEQTFVVYSSSSPYAAASFFGRAFSVDFTGSDTTINLMFKQLPGVVAETISQSQAATLQAKRCNVFVAYNNDTSILQYGTMSGPAFFDEIHGMDWLQNAIQTACYNVLYTSSTKVPQTDAGSNQLVNAVAGVCQQGVQNGLIAPGTWNATGFGQLQEGQYLKTGYYIYVESMALQSESDRAARKCPPIQVAVKLAGAIQSVNMAISVNR